MKVELEKLRLGYSELTKEIYAGITNKDGNKWLKKQNVTNSFLDCIIQRYENKTEVIKCGSHEWEITVKKI